MNECMNERQEVEPREEAHRIQKPVCLSSHLAPPLTSCVNLGISLHFSVPQFSPLYTVLTPHVCDEDYMR